MTTITINDSAQMVKVTGHAEFAEAGKDIVCAGVSALVWTLAASLQTQGALNYVDTEDGDVLLCYKALPGTEHYLEMFRIGAELLTFKYPENVCVQGRNSEADSDNMNTKGGVEA